MSDDSNGTTTRKKLRGGITGKGFVPGDPRINRAGRPKLATEIEYLEAIKRGASLEIIERAAQKIAEMAARGDVRAFEALTRKLAPDLARGELSVRGEMTQNVRDLDKFDAATRAEIVAQAERIASGAFLRGGLPTQAGGGTAEGGAGNSEYAGT